MTNLPEPFLRSKLADLWNSYRLEASKARPDPKAASAAWDNWLKVYLPDPEQRRAIPKPRWLA
jgi:hypothetical protein